MTAVLWAICKQIVLGLVPYADPIRRRRARRTARTLVSTRSWPLNDADVTGRALAELALLRILHLQTECRRAVRHRMPESAAALSRMAIEVCLFGLYCAHHEDSIDKVQAKNVAALHSVLNFLVTIDLISDSFLEECLAALDAAQDRLSVYRMAKEIDAKWHSSEVRRLYSGYYAPLSTLFVHANGLSLIRHVRRSGKLTIRPRFPWVKRSAMHSVDACMALLAVVLSEANSPARDSLRRYGEAHTKRILTPMIVMTGLWAHSSWTLREAIPTIRAIWDMRKYARSQQAIDDSPAARIERIRHGFDAAFGTFGSGELPSDVVQIFRDYLVTTVVEGIAGQADGAVNQASAERQPARPMC